MFHVRTLKVNTPRNQRGPLYAFHAASGLGPPNIKEQLRRGVLLATVSSVLLLVGSILTWLVFTEVFGSKVPIMGPLVMALGFLLLVLAIRQFCIVWKHKRQPSAEKEADGGNLGTGDEGDPDALEMDTWDTEGYKPSYTDYSCATQYSEPADTQDQLTLPNAIPTDTYTITTAALPQHSQSPIVKQLSNPLPPTTTLLDTLSVNPAQGVEKVRSCSDLMGMSSTDQEDKPNPRPVVRYSQGQLEMLDQRAAAGGSRISPTSMANAPSHHSLGEHSTSAQPYTGQRSLSLSIEKTDILETI